MSKIASVGARKTIVFGSLIDHSTLTAATISVTCPSGAEILTPESYIVKSPQTQSGTASVNATYTITDSSTETTLVIQPQTPLLPDTVYTVFLLGGDAQFSSARIKDASGNPLAVSYQWTFTTGSLALPSPPPASPLPSTYGAVVIQVFPSGRSRRGHARAWKPVFR